ncbi:MAG: 50S ribosomal protein L23 [Candidatus Peregrinibacteria bacterium]|nr:50S ribosomal protein L23 [Candidatus Peregrinibacteria bacterium]
MELYQVLIKPVVSEKATAEAGQGKYTFVVNKKATKIDIKNAIRMLYGVNATDVTVRPTPKKVRIVRRGQEMVKRKPVKKATVTLEAGKKIDIYKFNPTKK